MIPLAVLDTNVVLDAWWFADPAAAALAEAVERDRLRWVATPGMRDEIADVLGRPAFAHTPAAGAAVLAAFDRWADVRDPPAGFGAPRCTDPDDQVFVELAITAGARWLVSRDRALLTLAGPLRRWGVDVLAPLDWGAAAQAAVVGVVRT